MSPDTQKLHLNFAHIKKQLSYVHYYIVIPAILKELLGGRQSLVVIGVK